MKPRLDSSKLISTWIFVMLAASLVAIVDDGWLSRWAALAPEQIWHGQIWRLCTWALVEVHPYMLVFTCFAIYRFGGELAPRWGERRLRRFMIELVIACGIVTAIGALVSQQSMHMFRFGGWAISDALLIAWARQYPNANVCLFGGMLTLSGRKLVFFSVGLTLLLALSSSPFVMLPELVACIVAALYPRAWLAR